MTPSIKLIRNAMQQAIESIDRAETAEQFFASFTDNTSKAVVSDGHIYAGKAIAKVVDTVVEAANTGGIHVLTRQNMRDGSRTHSVIIAPTLECYEQA